MRSNLIPASAAAALCLAALAPSAAAEAPFAAASSSLIGTYAVSGNSTCLVSPLPFDSSGQPTNPRLAYPGTRGFAGTFSFKGNGTGTASFTALTIAGAPTATTAAETDSGKFRYTTLGGTTVITLKNVTATYQTGPEAGLSAIVDKIEFTATIAGDGRSLTLAGVQPDVETATFSDGSVFFSVCETAGTLIKM